MIKLARIFQDGMTFQRQKPIVIWGSSDCEQTLNIAINGIIVMSGVTVSGDFRLTLPPQEAAENCTFLISGATDQIRLTGVDIGEIWIAGGQSNMEFQLRYDAEGPEQIAAAFDPHCRFYDVGEFAFEGEEADGFKDTRGWDRWMSLDRENAEFFSAVGYYFTKQLRKKYQVPVAIVGCNWGGTTAATWQDKARLRADSDLSVYLKEYDAGLAKINLATYEAEDRKARRAMAKPQARESMDKLMYGTASKMIMAAMSIIVRATMNKPLGPHDANRPGGLYEAMLSKISGFSCRGVIWYQGESDAEHARIYGKLFASMIRCWREAWQDDLPFLFVQLAPFGHWMGIGGENYPLLRRQQEWVSKNVPGTAMASIMDAGMEKDIHPKRKRPVGERLALLAQGKVYGGDILCEAPELAAAEHMQDTLKLRFINTGSGFAVKGGKINALQVFANGREVKSFTAAASADLLTIQTPALMGMRATVKLAEVPYCEVNLYSSAGLPAKPFTWQEPG